MKLPNGFKNKALKTIIVVATVGSAAAFSVAFAQMNPFIIKGRVTHPPFNYGYGIHPHHCMSKGKAMPCFIHIHTTTPPPPVTTPPPVTPPPTTTTTSTTTVAPVQ